MDEENINQSFITTKFEKMPEEEEVEGVHEREFCRCGIYWLFFFICLLLMQL